MNVNVECFSDAELLMLSDGILALMANAEEALRLVKNKDVHGIISQEMQRYSDLNAKLCGMMGEV